jgi:hypothetical protein
MLQWVESGCCKRALLGFPALPPADG